MQRGDLHLQPIHGEMSLDAADKVCDLIAEFYGKNAQNA
jgi:hypothetical protein